MDLTASEIVFDKEESRHIERVMRKKVGDAIYSTDGRGHLVHGILSEVQPKQCIASIQAITERPPLPYKLHMAVAPTKHNDRFEWFLEKATEIGIDRITPIICDHSERRMIKPERLEKIIESAMKQSLKVFKPQLEPAVSFREFIAEQRPDAEGFLAHCMDSPKTLLKNAVQPKGSVLILIGPEGDFSGQELQLATSKGITPVTLGEQRLRTETAALVACHTVSLINS